MTAPPLHVTGVAIYDHELDAVYSLPAPARHHELIRKLAREGHEIPIQGEQGFLLSDGRFATRYTALEIARSAGQLLKETAPQHRLFSEDVW